jgi:hypothetical protein
MARIETDPNYSSPTFSRATAATDLFKKEDVQALASAMSTHDHTSGKGLAIGGAAITDGSISSAELASNSVTTIKIADANVTGAKIGSGEIAAGNLAANSVTTVKIADNAVTTAKLDGSTGIAPNLSAQNPPGTSQLTVASIAKGWALITFSAGTPSVAFGYNVSGVTDNGVGDVTVNWDRDFASTSYICLCTMDGGEGRVYVAIRNTTGARVITFNAGGAAADLSFSIVAFGTLS